MSKDMEKEKVTASLANFVQKNRIIIFSFLGALIIAATVLGIYMEVSKKFAATDVQRVENLSKKIQDWSSAMDEAKKLSMATIIEGVMATEGTNLGYDYAKAQFNFTSGQYWVQKKDWKNASLSFEKIVKETPNNYLAPVALLNLIQTYEQLEQKEDAILSCDSFLERYKTQTLLAPQVYFTKARILDQMGKIDEASAVFKSLIEAHPESSWTNLARTRLILLKK